MKEYEMLFDTGEAQNLVAEVNRMAMDGWQAKSIGAIGAVAISVGRLKVSQPQSFFNTKRFMRTG